MTNRFSTPILLACAAIGVACGSERVFEPGQQAVDPERAPVFTSLRITPEAVELFPVAPWDVVQLSVAALDQKGVPIQGLVAPTYFSSIPAVAVVNSSGVVKAGAPGITAIGAKLTLGGITRVAFMTATVYPLDDAARGISGVYDLTAPITGFDPAWGDLTGHRYTAVLTLHQYSPMTFAGTYTDLQVIDPAGESSDDWKYTGFVSGSLDGSGGVVIRLIGGNHTWTTWYGQGKLASHQMVGEFGCCGHISGTFTVVRR